MSVKRIFYNTVLQSAGKILSAIIGIITVAVMSRNLGKTGFGEYTTVASFMGLFSVLADLGLYLVMTKEISQVRTDETRILGNVLALRFMSALLLLTAGAAVALFFPYSKPVKQGMFLAIIAFSFISGTQVLAGLFQKYLIVTQLVISEIIQRLTMLALVVLAAWKHADALFRPRYGSLGFVALPNIFVFQVLFPLVSPVMDLLLVVSLVAAAVGRWQHPAEFTADTLWRVLFYYAIFQAIDFLSAVLAFVLEWRENFRLLVLLFWQRFFYRQLMYYVTVRSILASLRGGAVGWNKVERKATVSQI